METNHKRRGGKGQEASFATFKALPESMDQLSILGLLRFGGQELLRSAIAFEITESSVSRVTKKLDAISTSGSDAYLPDGQST